MSYALSAALLVASIVAHSAAENGQIAFTAAGSSNVGQQIFVAASDGTNRRQLTFLGQSAFPSWSRDGKRIVFSSNRTGRMEIFVMNSDGSAQTMIGTSAPGEKVVPQLSADGSLIAFAAVDPAIGHPEIWIMSVAGENPRRLTVTPKATSGPTWSLFPRFSPDARQLLYASTVTGSTQIWIMNVDGTHQRQLTFGLGPEFPDANAPNWSPNGDHIVFWSGFETEHGEVWSADPDGGNPRQLTNQPGTISSDNPVWSPDGRFILFDTNRAGRAEIWIMDENGSNQRRLLAIDLPNTQFSWQPVYPPGSGRRRAVLPYQ